MPSLSTTTSSPAKRPPMGKIRSWSAGLGAKLSTASSTTSTPDIDLTTQLEVRKKGIDNLYASTEAYWSYLSKKKPVPFDTSVLAVDDTSSVTSGTAKQEKKMLPVEALGLAMSSFSGAFPEGSAYGSCLGLLGEAHIKLGAIQSTFTKDTSSIFLARIARSKATLDSFTAALKKLDSASAKLESAQTKVQKSKKEKRELEEELRQAQAAYDEAATDVEVRGEKLKQAEYEDWECLTRYMEAQLEYVGQMQAVVHQVKSMWGQPPQQEAGARPRSSSAAKVRPAISRRSSAMDASSSKVASRSSLSLSNSDRAGSNDDAKQDTKEKKTRLRMPSFSGAGDTVSSISASIGRARGSSLFASTTASGEPSPEKDRESSKWNFIASRSAKKQPGFVSMDEAEALTDRPVPALPEREYVRPSVSALDVQLGAAEPDVRFSRDSFDSSNDGFAADDPSPFSPNADAEFLDVRRQTAHETIHERGESGLSYVDTGYLGNGAPVVGLNHTGVSAYSDSGDPFGGAMSPQQTGGQVDDDDEAQETQGLTNGSNAVAGASGWRSVLNPNSAATVKGRAPPPVPSSASYLSKSKARLAPPPPPLPSRNSS